MNKKKPVFKFNDVKELKSKSTSIAVIPARSGSRRIKNKNIKNFFGYPIIRYSILLAKKSKLFDAIIVSTDSLKIAKISKKAGAKIFFLRPKYLSKDKVTTLKVIRHTANFLKKKNVSINFICCIYPTAIMVTKKKLRLAFSYIKKNKYHYVIPISKFRLSNETFLEVSNKNIIKKKHKSKNLNKTFFNDTGQFYFGKYSAWLNNKALFNGKSKAIFLNKNEFVDVNNEIDWHLLKKLFKN
jgi:pseudaminic acid cytidylyltransferase